MGPSRRLILILDVICLSPARDRQIPLVGAQRREM